MANIMLKLYRWATWHHKLLQMASWWPPRFDVCHTINTVPATLSRVPKISVEMPPRRCADLSSTDFVGVCSREADSQPKSPPVESYVWLSTFNTKVVARLVPRDKRSPVASVMDESISLLRIVQHHVAAMASSARPYCLSRLEESD
jgi:hypothetical protein